MSEMLEQEEILNIQYHVGKMIVKALNRAVNVRDAAKLLGVTERTLYRYKWQYNVMYDRKSGTYFIPQGKTINI